VAALLADEPWDCKLAAMASRSLAVAIEHAFEKLNRPRATAIAGRIIR
jgi:hypothetical protein